MNAIQQLEARLVEKFPEATIVLDSPGLASAPWFLDIALKDFQVTVEWRGEKAFGISANREAALGGAEEVVSSLEAASKRVFDLLLCPQ